MWFVLLPWTNGRLLFKTNNRKPRRPYNRKVSKQVRPTAVTVSLTSVWTVESFPPLLRLLSVAITSEWPYCSTTHCRWNDSVSTLLRRGFNRDTARSPVLLRRSIAGTDRRTGGRTAFRCRATLQRGLMCRADSSSLLSVVHNRSVRAVAATQHDHRQHVGTWNESASKIIINGTVIFFLKPQWAFCR